MLNTFRKFLTSKFKKWQKAGAKVLNAQAVQFAKEAKIALYARDIF